MHTLGPVIYQKNYIFRVVNVPINELETSHQLDFFTIYRCGASNTYKLVHWIYR